MGTRDLLEWMMEYRPHLIGIYLLRKYQAAGELAWKLHHKPAHGDDKPLESLVTKSPAHRVPTTPSAPTVMAIASGLQMAKAGEHSPSLGGVARPDGEVKVVFFPSKNLATHTHTHITPRHHADQLQCRPGMRSSDCASCLLRRASPRCDGHVYVDRDSAGAHCYRSRCCCQCTLH